MSEIWNLSTLCRCCHADGNFRKLNRPYRKQNGIEIYELMLQETLGVKIIRPSLEQASYTICDNCIQKLRDASQFREQVLACEQKFKVYFTNEQFVSSGVQIEDEVKTEIELDSVPDSDSYDVNMDDDPHRDDNSLPPDDVDRTNSSEKDKDFIDSKICYDDKKTSIKQETFLEVDFKLPIKAEEELVKDIKNEEGVAVVKKIKQESVQKRKKSTLRKMTKNLNNLKKYVTKKRIGNKVTYGCKECEEVFKSQKEILFHIRRKHYRRFRCLVCDKYFKFATHLKCHIKTEHGKAYKCTMCNKKYDNRYKLNAHIKSHTEQRIYTCDICQKQLRYKSTLRKHILLHNEGNLQKILCDYCGWSFNQRCNLKAHINAVHFKLRPYSCNICGKTYTAQKHVKGHMKVKHSGNPKPYQCDHCFKSYACQKTFKLHKLTHSNIFNCKYCKLVFNTKTDLDVHKKTHSEYEYSESSQFGCHICGKYFKTRYTLNRHLDLHAGVKRYSCDICDIRFTQKSLLLRHNRRRHIPGCDIPEDKIKCEICNKFYKDIKRHMECHDPNKRNYFCDLCCKNYPSNNALLRHKNRIHFGVSYDCDICGKKYVQKGSVIRHKLKVHKTKSEVTGNNTEMNMDEGSETI